MKCRPGLTDWTLASLVAYCVLGATGCAQDVILGEQISLPPSPSLPAAVSNSETLGSVTTRESGDGGADGSSGGPPWDDHSGTETHWRPHPGEEPPPGPDRPRPGETLPNQRSDQSIPDFMFEPRTDQSLPDFTFDPQTEQPGPDFTFEPHSDAPRSSEF